MAENDSKRNEPRLYGRREVIRTGLYVAPVIFTLSIAPHFAGSASGPGGGYDQYPPSPPDSHDGSGGDGRGGLR